MDRAILPSPRWSMVVRGTHSVVRGGTTYRWSVVVVVQRQIAIRSWGDHAARSLGAPALGERSTSAIDHAARSMVGSHRTRSYRARRRDRAPASRDPPTAIPALRMDSAAQIANRDLRTRVRRSRIAIPIPGYGVGGREIASRDPSSGVRIAIPIARAAPQIA